jgi:general secretion pathway protein A
MYTKFYGLKEQPFEITPNPSFLYLSENHREALAHLTYAVKGRKGFTVITGEVGTGKTTLIQALLSKLNGSAKTAYVFNPNLGTTDFLHYICEDFGLNVKKGTKGQYLSQLHNFLMGCHSRNENVVLIIDEAQGLGPELLEEVRLLTNLETPRSKLLQVILMGQPELNDILNQRQFRQLKQRVSLRYNMRPLNKEEMNEYIKRRLRLAGASDPHFFTPKALNKIYRYSNGIPRLVNIVCDNALLTGYATDQAIIGDRIIREVTRNLDGLDIQGRRRFTRWMKWVLLTALCLAGLWTLWKYGLSVMGELDFSGWMRTIQRIGEEIYQTMSNQLSKIVP